MIVHSANSLLFAEPVMESRKQGFIKDAFDVLMLIIELSQLLTLLQLGSEVVNRIAEWKVNLFNAVILMEDDKEKDQMKDLVQVICKWDWRISAMGLFDIKKSLVCSIVTTILSYIIPIQTFG
ncbi:uncharacterized protein LOC118433989 [Folsomia candida]|nr:uncharacterized protein LOC118433989 [Folsomia candida]